MHRIWPRFNIIVDGAYMAYINIVEKQCGDLKDVVTDVHVQYCAPLRGCSYMSFRPVLNVGWFVVHYMLYAVLSRGMQEIHTPKTSRIRRHCFYPRQGKRR
jgi:hypothetical protein